MIVDQDRAAGGVVRRVPGQMNLADRSGGHRVQIREWILVEVVAAHVDVVDVQQDAAPGPAGELGQELGLGDRRVAEAEVAGRVLDQDRPAESLLNLLDPAARRLEPRFVVRQRQQMVEVCAAADAPREMLGDERRLDPFDQAFHAHEMPAVQRVGASEREPDSVERHRVVVPQALEPGHGRPAAQVVLGVDLEERDGRPGRHDLGDVGRPQPDSDRSGCVRRAFVARDHGTRRSPFIEVVQDRVGWRLAPTTLAQAPAGM